MKEHIILFGAGHFANVVVRYVEQYFDIEAVCDNNEALWRGQFYGKYPIISAMELQEKYADYYVLIALADRKNYDAISEQLESMNVRYRHVNDALYDSCMEAETTFCIDENNKDEIEKMRSNERNIFLLTAPAHSNLGDQAQTYCTEQLLKQKYSDYGIFIYDESRLQNNFYELLYVIKQNLKKEDKIFLHSGYRLTNLYMVSEYLVEMMGQLFADREMLFLPQTIHFTDEKIKRRLSEKISSNVTIMCRDIVSYQNASEIFPKSKIVLYPDMVTSLIGRYHFKHQRKGILFCLRKNGDGESLISDDEEKKLIDDIKKIAEASVTDTTISVDWRKIAENRKYYVEKEIEYYSKFQLVITNRYHGTIFSLAADTPVIVLPTKDHKITAGLRWFEEAEYDGIYYCNKSEEVRAVAQDIIDRCETICHPDYFYQKYYKDFMIEEV